MDEFISPIRPFSVVDHPDKPISWVRQNFPFGVVALVTNDRNRVLFEWIDRAMIHGTGPFLELPRGGGHYGEAPVEAGRREVREETGLLIPQHAIECVGAFRPDSGLTETVVHVVRARIDIDATGELKPQEDEGIKSLTWIPFNEVIEYLQSGFLRCGISIAAVALCCATTNSLNGVAGRQDA